MLSRNARARKRPSESTTLVPLSPLSRQCLRNLARYEPPPPVRVPRSHRAAVLIALFVGRMGDLYVLLTQRSLTLTSYAGDTALPGGKADRRDRTPEETARREAFEEIGLPKDPRIVPHLCTLEPFLAGNNIIVTPVVVLITDNALHPVLNAPEVSTLFSHPLLAFLSSSTPFPSTESVDAEYHTFRDIDWNGDPAAGRVRMHRFLTGREGEGIKPVFGLTAAILVRAAEIGYGRPPEFEVMAPGQKTIRERIAWALRHVPRLREGAEKEGITWHLPEEEREARGRKHKRERSKL
ncbi:hypothetical protein CALCODRAFT_478751 [Calocera cornea HHB12733]|uniref:Nudix hydrolase domain-containing protein n=1 Tax=Calocera cornea HHB12733 TaxID=1353952 RepID=A0A165K974_9BASI|nr:hypothetical protein CALCODRAFT_478751 [Calocera cornea HHB12733]